jgi:hypothetical protein
MPRIFHYWNWLVINFKVHTGVAVFPLSLILYLLFKIYCTDELTKYNSFQTMTLSSPASVHTATCDCIANVHLYKLLSCTCFCTFDTSWITVAKRIWKNNHSTLNTQDKVQLTTQYYLNHKAKLWMHASVISCDYFLVKCVTSVLSSQHSTSEPSNELLMPTGYTHLSINVQQWQ